MDHTDIPPLEGGPAKKCGAADAEFRNPHSSEIPTLKQMWQICFGDSVEYIEYYFQNAYVRKNTFVLAKEGELLSMQTLLPACLHCGGKVYRGRYVYAVATLPQYRGMGCMGKLSEYTENYAKENQNDFLFLVPAEQSLFSLYEGMGYSTCSYLEERSCGKIASRKTDRKADSLKEWNCTELTEGAFLKQRKEYLRKIGMSIDLTEAIRSYSYRELRRSGCGMLRLFRMGEEKYLIYFTAENRIIILETDAEAEVLEVFLPRLIAMSKKGGECQIRLPLHSADRVIAARPYGMIKFLTDDPIEPICFQGGIYANLMLD